MPCAHLPTQGDAATAQFEHFSFADEDFVQSALEDTKEGTDAEDDEDDGFDGDAAAARWKEIADAVDAAAVDSPTLSPIPPPSSSVPVYSMPATGGAEGAAVGSRS